MNAVETQEAAVALDPKTKEKKTRREKFADKCAAWATPVAIFVFFAALIGGTVTNFIWNSQDFDSHKSSTTVAVFKGPGASRRVERVELPRPRSPAEIATEQSMPGERTIESREERPAGEKFARAKSTSEEQPPSFLENAIGDTGLSILQLAAILLASFVVAAIVQRVLGGNFTFKIGSFELPQLEGEKESAAYAAALTDSIRKISKALNRLERKQGARPTEITIPSARIYLEQRAQTISLAAARSGLPSQTPTAIEEEIKARKEEFAKPPVRSESPTEASSPRTPTAKPRPTDVQAPADVRAPVLEDRETTQPIDEQAAEVERETEEADDLSGLTAEEWLEESPKLSGPISEVFRRSGETYGAIRTLLRDERPLQASRLVQPLYEEVAVARSPLSEVESQEGGGGSDRLQSVIEKWLGELDLKGSPVASSFETGEWADQANLVDFISAWLVGQQLYRQAELEEAPPKRVEEIDLAWYPWLTKLGLEAVGPRATAALLGLWAERHQGLQGES